MNFESTRGVKTQDGQSFTTAHAIYNGLASDGGLFVPKSLPQVDPILFKAMLGKRYAERASSIIGALADDLPQDKIKDYCHRVYDGFSKKGVTAPVENLVDDTHILNLSEGKTNAFKDFALQMLPYLVDLSARQLGKTDKIIIPVATSGDTGKAAMEAFAGIPNTKVVTFFPNSGVSPIQRKQMTTQQGNNISVCPIDGNFDDAQKGVKAVMSDTEYRNQLQTKGFSLSAANSINWGRIMPQIAYYFSAYCDMVNNGAVKMGDKIDTVVPTGNFGNILAAYYAKQMGMPIGKLVCASNSNNILTDFINTGVYDTNGRGLKVTSSPSMDILVSSNLERFLYEMHNKDSQKIDGLMTDLNSTGKFEIDPNVLQRVQGIMTADFASEKETHATIKKTFDQTGRVIDTHTAVAECVRQKKAARGEITNPALVVSTASPYKFPKSVLSALSQDVPKNEFDCLKELSDISGTTIPDNLKYLENTPERFTKVYQISQMQDCISAVSINKKIGQLKNCVLPTTSANKANIK